jgi:tetratricopeptide (TPR) repeat protein
MIRCPFCGFENGDDAQRCRACGSILRTRSTAPGTAVQPDAEEKSEVRAPGDLVGRSAQIDAIVEQARKVAQKGRSAVVFLEGEDGAGKTALATHGLKQIREKLGSFSTVQCSCRPGGRDPFAPIESLVLQILRIPTFARERSREILEERVRDQIEAMRLFEGGEAIAEHTRSIADLLAPAAYAESVDITEVRRAAPMDRLMRTLEQVLVALTETRHLAILFDDIRNGTPEGHFLVTNLYESLMGRPLLWIFTVGTEDEKVLESLQGVRVPVEPLSEWEVGLVLQDIFPDLRPFPDELWQILARTSGGNPGTLHHLVGLLIDERALVLDEDGVWHFNADKLQEDDLPLDREAVLRVRYEGLDASQRQALDLASIAGNVFWNDTIMMLMRLDKKLPSPDAPAQVWPDDREYLMIDDMLGDLARKGFVSQVKDSSFPGINEYVFMHDGFRKSLRDALPESSASAGHRAVARWMEMSAADRRSDFAELIAYHWEKGSQRGEAAEFYIEAADVARRRYLFDRSIELYRKALEHLDESDASTHMSLLHDLGSVHQMRGETEEAMQCFGQMLSIAWRYVNRSKAAAALSKIGRIYRTHGDYSAARAYLERALKLFQHSDDRRGIASTQDDLGNIHYLQGNYDRAAKLYLEAINLREELGDGRGLALSYEHLGQVDRAMGNLTQAESRFSQALEMRRSIGDEEGMCSALNALGVVAYDRGATEAAVAMWREALDLAMRTGNLRMQEFLYNNLGEALVAQKRLQQAEGYFKHALELSMSLADRRAETEICRNLGLLYMEMATRPLGREYLNRSLSIARDIGSREATGLALRALGQLEGHSVFDETAGPEGSAESYFLEATDIFESMGNETELLKTYEAYARYLFDHSRPAEAADLLEKAVAFAERMGEETVERLRREADRMRRYA